MGRAKHTRHRTNSLSGEFGLKIERVILHALLPYVTGPDFTVKWSWRPGDIVAWDNRCTIHAATDYGRYKREMWRLTLRDKAQAA